MRLLVRTPPQEISNLQQKTIIVDDMDPPHLVRTPPTVFAEMTEELCSSTVPHRNDLLFVMAPTVLDTLTTAPQDTRNDEQVIGQLTSLSLKPNLSKKKNASEIQKSFSETVPARKSIRSKNLLARTSLSPIRKSSKKHEIGREKTPSKPHAKGGTSLRKNQAKN